MEGMEVSLPMQVADVVKVLAAVHMMVDAGNEVVFNKGGGYIRHLETGAKTMMYRENDAFCFDLQVPKAGEKPNEGANQGSEGASGFTRQVSGARSAVNQNW